MLVQALGQAMLLGMHIPDGFLSAPVALLWWVLTIAALAVAVQRVRGFDERRVPLMGVMAAFIFAARCSTSPCSAAPRAISSAVRSRRYCLAPGRECW